MVRLQNFLITTTFLVALLLPGKLASAQPGYIAADTITAQAVVYNGDTLEAKTLENVYFYSRLNEAQLSARAKYNRLRNAVYVTYPYARRAGAVMNDINDNLVGVAKKGDRKKYIHSREAELRKEFTNPLTNLSIYQGKVLMKLINRETGNNCYEIIKEYKGGFNARLYQTVAFFFNSNLKQPYDAAADDAVIEKLVKEVQRMHGYQDNVKTQGRLSSM
ncbi:MAG: DUF4294 domain-containing protein [Rhizobacter sp.]|nr:DUF4294 domain-containing protein [Ferruginibacter sp.]